MPTIITRGAGSAQALGYAAKSTDANFIEDVFSTFLYTGNGSTQTITNGIDLAGEGGLVWIKGRSNATDHALYDTARGATKDLVSNSSAAETTQAAGLTAFSGTGFSLGALAKLNTSAATYCSWTFRKQPKFFDVVTYTGNGVAGRQIAHNLGAEVGALFIKCTSSSGTFWIAWHRSEPTKFGALNQTSAFSTSLNGFTTANIIGDNTTVTTPTSTNFTVADSSVNNASGATYVAYLFAHNAGGFGLTGTDNVISCGSYTGTGVNPGPVINLGYEPQFIIVKNTTVAVDWFMYDTMRGMPVSDVNTGGTKLLRPNTSAVEQGGNTISPTATGFQINTTAAGANTTGDNYIYIAIRRGPMKVPTSGTKVFIPIARTGTGADAIVSGVSFAPDTVFSANREFGDTGNYDKLRGVGIRLETINTGAEVTNMTTLTAFLNNGFGVGTDSSAVINNNFGGGEPTLDKYINWVFGRAPGFFDVVCYTGSNGFQDLSHNLGVTPQMVIIKNRSSAANWTVGLQGITGTGKYLVLNSTAAVASDVNYFGSTWTSTNVLIDGNVAPINQSGSKYVMYLFATVAGVSKVGSYTGTGTTQVINCGFTAGARFILIKRTDGTGNWFVWDSARGIVPGNDPYLPINTNGAEITSTDFVDTAASGFEISSTAPAAINANGGSFIFLAIA